MIAHTLVRVINVKAAIVVLLAHPVLVKMVVRQLVRQVVDRIALLHARKVVIQLPVAPITAQQLVKRVVVRNVLAFATFSVVILVVIKLQVNLRQNIL